MAATNPTLFTWDDVENLPDIRRFELVKQYLPDGDIIKALKSNRSRGRNDFPVEAMWNALLAGIVFQHGSMASLLRELRRNPALLTVCGFNPLPRQSKPVTQLQRNVQTGKMEILRTVEAPKEAVPESWNFSRFLGNVIQLEEEHGLIRQMIKTLRDQLMAELPELGRHLGYDGKAIHSHSTGRLTASTEETSDPQADWGHHETRGVDNKSGKAWTKIKNWFGYGVHLIADTHYEIPVAFRLTPASASEQIELDGLLDELFEETPALSERCQDFSADRGLDSGPLKAKLWDNHAIRPLIDTREMWREEKRMPDYDPQKPVTRPLYSQRADTIVHTEKGRVFCVCPVSQEQRDLAFQGFEADRNTLKYRCPAAAYGFACSGKERCHQMGQVNAGEYGRIVRIDITQQNRRIFVPTPYGSPSWRRGYNRRSALERINNRIDNSFCFEKHFIRGQGKMQTRVGLALAMMMAMALGHVKEGREKQMRSLVRPIPITDSG
ncbi:MAG: transposase [Gammaproteobacteria bacterium]